MKTEILIWVISKIVIPIAVKTGKSYLDERKLFKQILREFRGRQLHNRRQVIWYG